MKGVKNGSVKISEEDALWIRYIYPRYKIAAHSLGGVFGIAESQTLRILSGESWKHIPLKPESVPIQQ